MLQSRGSPLKLRLGAFLWARNRASFVCLFVFDVPLSWINDMPQFNLVLQMFAEPPLWLTYKNANNSKYCHWASGRLASQMTPRISASSAVKKAGLTYEP